jgi:diguanylate cyclase (GGDEF)-like protein
VELRSLLEGLAEHADMLILDADLPQLSFDRSPLLRRPEARYVYTLLLCDPQRMPNVTDALEWGVDDLLRVPVSNGEVLARLRAGARFLEFERRASEQATRDRLTKLLTQSGLMAVMRKTALAVGPQDSAHALIVADLDHFSRVDHQYGRKPSDEILATVGSTLRNLATARSQVARLSEDQFALLVACDEPGEGAAMAESVREAIAHLPLTIGGDKVRLTASVAYGDFDPRTDVPLEVLERVTEAVAHAKSSGRNCVVRAGEFDGPFAEWRKELNTGNPFAAVTARDVMQPFGHLLRPGVDLSRVSPQFLRSALEYFAVVDGNQSLIGTIHRDELGGRAPGRVSQVSTDFGPPLHQPFTVPEEAPFGDLVERFTTEDDPLVVVVRKHEPRGYITREGFLNLIEPIHTGSFRPTSPFSADASYLVVPEFVRLEES